VTKFAVKLEVLSNAAFRPILRKIDNFIKGKKTKNIKLETIKDYLGPVNQIIESDKEALTDSIKQWRTNLRRKETARQYNQKEMKYLLSGSEICLKIYKAYIQAIVCSPVQVKTQVLNLAHWPQDGDEAIKRILLSYCSNASVTQNDAPVRDCDNLPVNCCDSPSEQRSSDEHWADYEQEEFWWYFWKEEDLRLTIYYSADDVG
jgi:hypothetical protein